MRQHGHGPARAGASRGAAARARRPGGRGPALSLIAACYGTKSISRCFIKAFLNFNLERCADRASRKPLDPVHTAPVS